MERLEYKGYTGSIEYSVADKCLFGQVAGIRKNICITYEGNTIRELKEDFEGAIDFYLEHCKEKGISPEISHIQKPSAHLSVTAFASK